MTVSMTVFNNNLREGNEWIDLNSAFLWRNWTQKIVRCIFIAALNDRTTVKHSLRAFMRGFRAFCGGPRIICHSIVENPAENGMNYTSYFYGWILKHLGIWWGTISSTQNFCADFPSYLTYRNRFWNTAMHILNTYTDRTLPVAPDI